MILDKKIYTNIDYKEEIKFLERATKKILKSKSKCKRFIIEIHKKIKL